MGATRPAPVLPPARLEDGLCRLNGTRYSMSSELGPATR